MDGKGTVYIEGFLIKKVRIVLFD